MVRVVAPGASLAAAGAGAGLCCFWQPVEKMAVQSTALTPTSVAMLVWVIRFPFVEPAQAVRPPSGPVQKAGSPKMLLRVFPRLSFTGSACASGCRRCRARSPGGSRCCRRHRYLPEGARSCYETCRQSTDKSPAASTVRPGPREAPRLSGRRPDVARSFCCMASISGARSRGWTGIVFVRPRHAQSPAPCSWRRAVCGAPGRPLGRRT